MFYILNNHEYMYALLQNVCTILLAQQQQNVYIVKWIGTSEPSTVQRLSAFQRVRL